MKKKCARKKSKAVRKMKKERSQRKESRLSRKNKRSMYITNKKQKSGRHQNELQSHLAKTRRTKRSRMKKKTRGRRLRKRKLSKSPRTSKNSGVAGMIYFIILSLIFRQTLWLHFTEQSVYKERQSYPIVQL